MLCRWLIVDGFSLLYREERWAAVHRAGRLASARGQLVAWLDRISGGLAERTTVVFDGRGEGGPGEEFAGASVEVLYSPAALTADSVIERLVCAERDASEVLVVSSDRAERETVSAAGAQTLSCGDFLERARREEAQLARRGAARRPPRHTLGDYL